MKIGVVARTAERWLNGDPTSFADFRDLALAAEAAALDSFWFPDHLTLYTSDGDPLGCWETSTILGGLAAVASSISLGPFVTAIGFRNPALLAKMATTLDGMSAGRFILGLGAGNWEAEHHAFGYPFDHRVGRFEEVIGIIAPLLRDDAVDFHGTYHSAPDCILRPRGPSQASPPIWIGAKGARMLRIAARHADGYVAIWPTTLAQVVAERDRLVAACAEVGRDPTTIDLVVGTHVLLPEDARTASDDRAISGTHEEIAARLRAFADASVAHVVIDPRPDISLHAVEGLGRVAELLG